jgi:hypothetical protein
MSKPRDFVRQPAKTVNGFFFVIFTGKMTFSEGADDGIRTHTPFSRERILSPLRLPFRHIGGLQRLRV